MSLSARGPAISLFALLLDKLNDRKSRSSVAAAEYFTCARCGETLAPCSLKNDFRSPRPTEGAAIFDDVEPSVVMVSNPLGVIVSLVTLQPDNGVHLERSGLFENSWFQGYLSTRVSCPKCHDIVGWALARGSKPISRRTPKNPAVTRFIPDPARRPVVFACGEAEEQLQPKAPSYHYKNDVNHGSRRRARHVRPQISSKADEESVTLGEIVARATELEKTGGHLESRQQIQSSETAEAQLSGMAKVQISDVVDVIESKCFDHHGNSADRWNSQSPHSGCQSERPSESETHGSGSIFECIRASDEAMVPAASTGDIGIILRCRRPDQEVKAGEMEQVVASESQSLPATNPSLTLGRKLVVTCDDTQARSLIKAHETQGSKVELPIPTELRIPDVSKHMPLPFEVKPPEAPKAPHTPRLKVTIRRCNPNHGLSRPPLQVFPTSRVGSAVTRRVGAARMSWLPSGCLSGATTPPPGIQSAR